MISLIVFLCFHAFKLLSVSLVLIIWSAATPKRLHINYN